MAHPDLLLVQDAVLVIPGVEPLGHAEQVLGEMGQLQGASRLRDHLAQAARLDHQPPVIGPVGGIEVPVVGEPDRVGEIPAPVAESLPELGCIAGLILTVGMAVDANVLIFERIREELEKGKSVRASIDSGYARATVTIIDANVTTILAALVLFQFGSGPVKGFAITLFWGIAASMFTAIFMTRTIFMATTNRPHVKELSI